MKRSLYESIKIVFSKSSKTDSLDKENLFIDSDFLVGIEKSKELDVECFI